MIDGPLAAYRRLQEEGWFESDPAQALAVQKLQSLHLALRDYRPAAGLAAWKARFGLSRRHGEPPQGLYICGEVGRGKSMLMAMFFDNVSIDKKRRVHFQVFMQEIHKRLKSWRDGHPHADADPIAAIAHAIVDDAWLLCLDELEIRDITDAMIVGRLFEHLLAAGAVVVTTSNRPPGDLYKDGLQREKFVPFVDLINRRLDVLVLEAKRDYRRDRLRSLPVYHWPLDDAARDAVDEAFSFLAVDRRPETYEIEILGRRVRIPEVVHGVAKFSFDDICGRPLASADYLRIAKLYPTVIVTGIPRMGPANADKARRFVLLIDALYEQRVMLICSAETPPEELFTHGEGSFEFARTVSRLIEMQAQDYLGLCGLT